MKFMKEVAKTGPLAINESEELGGPFHELVNTLKNELKLTFNIFWTFILMFNSQSVIS